MHPVAANRVGLHGLEIRTLYEASVVSPISTNLWACDFRDCGKYATMTYTHGTQAVINQVYFRMLLKTLIVRSTRQKGESFSRCMGDGKSPALLGDELLFLGWNGQANSYSHRRDL